MNKRIIAMLLACCMLLGMLTGCGKKEEASVPAIGPAGEASGSMSRGEWIMTLGANMGMNEYAQQEPHFSDVTADKACFPFVQSCYEWGVLADEGTEFRPDDPATKEFVAKTSVLAAELIDAEELGETANAAETLRTYATDSGIVTDGDWEETISRDDAIMAAAAAKDAYFENRPDEICEYTYLDNVVELSSTDSYTMSGDTLTLSSDMGQQVNVGDVFVVPATGDMVSVRAVKVTGVSYAADGSAVLETETPALEEVYEELNICGTAAPTMESFQLSEGVTLTSASAEEAVLSDLVSSGEKTEAEETAKGESYTFTVSATVNEKGEITGSATVGHSKDNVSKSLNLSKLQSTLADQLKKNDGTKQNDDGSVTDTKTTVDAKDTDQLKEVLEDSGMEEPKTAQDGEKPKSSPAQKLKANTTTTKSLAVTGSVTLKNLYITPSVEYKHEWLGALGGIKRIVVETNYDAEISVSVKGAINTKVLVGKATIPVVGGGAVMSVDVDVYLYFGINGEVKLVVAVGSNQIFEYDSGNYKKTEDSYFKTDMKAAVTVEGGVKPDFTVNIAMIPIIDLAAQAGAQLTASVEYEEKVTESLELNDKSKVETVVWGNYITTSVKICGPLITLKVSDNSKTAASKLGIGGSWNLITADTAPIQLKPDWGNKTYPLMEATQVVTTTWEDKVPDEVAEEAGGEPAETPAETGKNEFARLSIDKFVLNLNKGESGKVTVIGLPDGVNMGDVRFTSSDSSVATVDQGGNVKAVGAGVANIKVSVGGSVQICAVSVLEQQTAPDKNLLLP